MVIEFLFRYKFFRKISLKVWQKRTRSIFKNIRPYLNKQDKILDIGAGGCSVCKALMQNGFNVTPLDIKNLSCEEDIKPVIFDGEKNPFNDNEFNVSLLITVLHHILQPEKIILEAKRVSQSIVIQEDIHKNSIQKYLTFLMDSITNLELLGHPHSNKSDKEWKQLFNKLGLKLKDAKYKTFWGIFDNVIYYLEK